jgi:4-amino-4-deoxy-L-arabinose transferase-like glycosyltransferase
MDVVRYFTKHQYKRLFLLAWLILGLLQAYYTQLLDDEAYYWVYSRHLDWGYFDHPPMVALLIKIGYGLFHNELGVRICMVILNLFTLIITEKLIARRDNRIFYLLLCSMGVMQLGGMLAVPDVPLIFFAALYFLIYRSFLEQQSWKNTFLLALSMALMFYSKYHGVLLVVFTVLSNLNLLRVFKFYVAIVITTILFFPHLYWQYAHGFPSLQYHLVERNASSYSFNYSTDYILGQILLFGPLAGWLILYYAFVCPIQSAFERALKVSVIGVLVFFLLSTFKGRVEANWTVMLFTPAMVLAHQSIFRKKRSLTLLKYLAPATLLVVFIARVYMVWDFAPGVEIRSEIHDNKGWAAAIQQKSEGSPVVFMSSYQIASKYLFYSHNGVAYSLNSRYERRNQYNYWDTEKQLWGKRVLIATVTDASLPVTGTILTPKLKGRLESYYIQNPYYSYSLIQLIPALKEVKTQPGVHMTFVLQLKNGYNQPVPVDTAQMPVLGYAFMQKDEKLPAVKSTMTLSKAIDRRIIKMEVVMPDQPGTYQLKFCVFAGILPPTHNSQTVKVVVE